MTVLLTGGAGFIGKAIIRRLSGERTLHAVSRAQRTDKDVTWHTLDLSDATAVEELIKAIRPTHLIHAAWVTTPGRFWASPDNLDWLASTMRLVRSFVAHGGRRVVGLGSAAEYVPRRGRIPPTAPVQGATLYGTTKAATGTILVAAAETLGIGLAWARVFQPYGAGEHPARLVPSLVRELRKGRPVPVSAGEQKRDFVHVDDVADAVARLVDADGTGYWNIGTGHAPAVRQVIELVAERLGRPDLVQWGDAQMQVGEAPELCADPTTTTALGWSPRPWKDGVQSFVDDLSRP